MKNKKIQNVHDSRWFELYDTLVLDTGDRLGVKEHDILVVYSLVNQFFWIALKEFLGGYYTLFIDKDSLEFWDERLETGFNEYPDKYY